MFCQGQIDRSKRKTRTHANHERSDDIYREREGGRELGRSRSPSDLIDKQIEMALRALNYITVGAALGFWAAWRMKSNLWDVEKLVDAAVPRPVATQFKEYVSQGGADARRMRRLGETVQEHKRLTAESLREHTRLVAESHRETRESLRQLLAIVAEDRQERLKQQKAASAEERLRQQKASPPPPTRSS